MSASTLSNDLLLDIYKKITNKGFSREEYEQIKKLAVAPGLSVADYIEMRLSLGNVAWEGDLLKEVEMVE